MARKKRRKPVVGKLVFTRENYWIFFVGVAMIILGFIFMAAGDTYSTLSLVISPIILFLGFLVLIPIAIVYKHKSSEDTSREDA